MTGLRRKSRILALKVLYEIDCSRHTAEEVLTRILPDSDLPAQAINFARELIQGVLRYQQDIDSQIVHFAPLFPLAQIAIIDRNILRLALYEIMFNDQTPVKAVINEAIEIAKEYGSDGSPKFINGVLGSVIASKNRMP